MSKLFEDMLKDEKYSKLFDNFDEKNREIVLNAMRALVSDFEEKILKPITEQNEASNPQKKTSNF